jgi:hypothetical protein
MAGFIIIGTIVLCVLGWLVEGNLVERDISCDDCGRTIRVKRSEYKKEDHKAGLINYYCHDCAAKRRNS